MPLYQYHCKKCSERWEKVSTVDERNDFKPDNHDCDGDVVITIGAANIVAGVNTNSKVPHWFKDKVKDMKKESGKDNTLGKVV